MKNDKEFLYKLLMLLTRAGVGVYLFTFVVFFIILFGGLLKEVITPAAMELLVGSISKII